MNTLLRLIISELHVMLAGQGNSFSIGSQMNTLVRLVLSHWFDQWQRHWLKLQASVVIQLFTVQYKQ